MRKKEKKEKKKGGCLKKILIIIVVLAALGAISSGGNDTSAPETSTPVSNIVEVTTTEAPTKKPTAAPTATPTVAPTIAPTATPATPDEWVRINAEKIYGDSLLSIEWQDVDDDPMIVIQCVFEDNFTFDLRHAVFMGDAKNMFKAVSELGKDGKIKYSSCYIQGRTTFLDKYGNEFDGNAIEIRLKKADMEQINWTNINHDMMIDLAAPYTIHPVFRK